MKLGRLAKKSFGSDSSSESWTLRRGRLARRRCRRQRAVGRAPRPSPSPPPPRPPLPRSSSARSLRSPRFIMSTLLSDWGDATTRFFNGRNTLKSSSSLVGVRLNLARRRACRPSLLAAPTAGEKSGQARDPVGPSSHPRRRDVAAPRVADDHAVSPAPDRCYPASAGLLVRGAASATALASPRGLLRMPEVKTTNTQTARTRLSASSGYNESCISTNGRWQRFSSGPRPTQGAAQGPDQVSPNRAAVAGAADVE